MQVFGFVNGDGAASLLNTAPLLAAVAGMMPAPYVGQSNMPPGAQHSPMLDPRVPAFVFDPVGVPLPFWDGGGLGPAMSEAAVGREATYLGQA